MAVWIGPLFCLALVAGLVAISGRASGWNDLYWSHGHAEDALPAQAIHRYRWIGCRIGGWATTMHIKVYPDGLWMAPIFPMSLSMKPVLVPWSAFNLLGDSLIYFGAKMFLIEGGPAAMCFTGWRGRKVIAEIERRRDDAFVKAARASLPKYPFRVPTVFPMDRS